MMPRHESLRDSVFEREPCSLDEVLARVLDRGIVIDADVRLDVAGLSLAGVDARFVVASIDTHLRMSSGGWIGGEPSHIPLREIESPPPEPSEGDTPRRGLLRPLPDESAPD